MLQNVYLDDIMIYYPGLVWIWIIDSLVQSSNAFVKYRCTAKVETSTITNFCKELLDFGMFRKNYWRLPAQKILNVQKTI